jgi:hypothetical protein
MVQGAKLTNIFGVILKILVMIRTIRTSTGVKRIEDHNHNAALLKLREILSEERKFLINRIESDLNAYIQYRFSRKTNASQLERIRGKLNSLKTSNVDLDNYAVIVSNFFRQENTHISAEPFYRDIDECLTDEFRPIQLKFVG